MLILIIIILGASTLTESVLRHHTHYAEFTVGSKNGVEQEILSEMMAILLEEKYGFRIKRKFHLEGILIAFHALLSKDIDLLPEYTGTAFSEILHLRELRGKSLDWLREEFRKKYQIEWLEPFGHLSQFTFLVRNESPFYTISDLENRQLKLGLKADFLLRTEYSLLKKSYPIFDQTLLLDENLIYLMLHQKDLDVGVGTSTDGRIDKYHLRELVDEKGILPLYQAVPIVRQESLKKYPQLEVALLELKGITNNQEIRRLNDLVNTNKKTAYQAARDFLCEKNLLSVCVKE